MPRYLVTLPLTGTISVEVDAEDEESAITAALASEDVIVTNIEEWEVHRQICRGNVLYASQNEAEVREID